jgi:hypothetical protein
MTRVNWHIIGFSGGETRRSRFDGERLTAAERTGGKRGGASLALLPDDYFFFDLVSAPKSMRERRMHAGLLLRMSHNFPAPVPEQERGAFRATPRDIVGYNTHPALGEFINEHGAELESADVVSTSFILALAAARSQGLEFWSWESGDGPAALFHAGELQYFRSGGEELEKRIRLAGADAEPERLDLEKSLAMLAENKVPLSSLRLPLRRLRPERASEPRFWAGVTAAVLLAGILFCAGQGLRLYDARQNARAYQTAIDELYSRALGEDTGADPFGRLLFLLEQRKGGGRKGADLLGLLALLSRNAPPDLQVESMAFSGDTGDVRGLVKGFDSLENMLAGLSRAEDYEFSLEQASNTADGVLLNLNFSRR